MASNLFFVIILLLLSCSDDKGNVEEQPPLGLALAQDVDELCMSLEAVFLHELKNSKVCIYEEQYYPMERVLPDGL